MRVATESRWNVKRRHHPYMLLCYLLYFNRKGYLLYMLSYVLFMLELRTAVHAVLSTVHAALRLCYNIYCTRCATTCSTAWLRAHLVTERTYRPGLEPSLDTVQVKYVPTASKCDGQAVLVVWRRVRLFKFTEATRLCVKHNAKMSAKISQASNPEAYTFTKLLFMLYHTTQHSARASRRHGAEVPVYAAVHTEHSGSSSDRNTSHGAGRFAKYTTLKDAWLRRASTVLNLAMDAFNVAGLMLLQ